MAACAGTAGAPYPAGGEREVPTVKVAQFRARIVHIRGIEELECSFAPHHGECDMPLWSKEPKSKQTAEAAKTKAAPPEAAKEPPKSAPKVAKAAETAPKPQAEPELSAADMRKRREVSARLLMRFGEVVSVLMRAPQFRDLPLKQLQELVVPPLLSGQFLVAEAQSKAQGFVTPVAAALWARVSKEIDQRLSLDLDKPMQLSPKDWNSGDIGWLIVLAGNLQALAPLLKQLQETTFKGRPVKMRAKGKDGKTVITTLSA
jgi:hemolysin-activating ACP:hemolysin acyltransferase